ncbi:Hypothetical protein SRAE_2000027500 [Strongyloides ratti]|uniref:Uncharacterized protein n=1 Tax=Strongyloides ratti TaxID=34506 RepID=A0A090LBT3_STRRB|nr:Hypothetical protein SRAE_2000027500 [Strongyloides ratti]CEF65598.1 Hypothetical protein SRAE_2000027500 [Strongyloides ratti]
MASKRPYDKSSNADEENMDSPLGPRTFGIPRKRINTGSSRDRFPLANHNFFGSTFYSVNSISFTESNPEESITSEILSLDDDISPPSYGKLNNSSVTTLDKDVSDVVENLIQNVSTLNSCSNSTNSEFKLLSFPRNYGESNFFLFDNKEVNQVSQLSFDEKEEKVYDLFEKVGKTNLELQNDNKKDDGKIDEHSDKSNLLFYQFEEKKDSQDNSNLLLEVAKNERDQATYKFHEKEKLFMKEKENYEIKISMLNNYIEELKKNLLESNNQVENLKKINMEYENVYEELNKKTTDFGKALNHLETLNACVIMHQESFSEKVQYIKAISHNFDECQKKLSSIKNNISEKEKIVRISGESIINLDHGKENLLFNEDCLTNDDKEILKHDQEFNKLNIQLCKEISSLKSQLQIISKKISDSEIKQKKLFNESEECIVNRTTSLVEPSQYFLNDSVKTTISEVIGELEEDYYCNSQALEEVEGKIKNSSYFSDK